MSEKKAKENRKIVSRIVIIAYSNGQITIDGFKDNLNVAMQQMYQGEMAVINYFMNKPKSNLIKLQ